MGWEGTGKSTICGHAVAECQKKGGNVVYIDGEHAVDKNYFEAIGVNTADMLISQPSCGEEGFNIALEMIKTGEVDLIIIDSDSSLVPKKVIEGEVPTANTVLVVPFVPLSPTFIFPLNVCTPPVMSLFKLIVLPVIVTDEGLAELVPVKVVGSAPMSPLSVIVLPVALS